MNTYCDYYQNHPGYQTYHGCETVIAEPLIPSQVAIGVPFIGANGVLMEGTLVGDCPSQFTVHLQDSNEKPIHGALIFVSTDRAGTDIVDVTITDQYGNGEFTGLELGTYYAITEIDDHVVDTRSFEVRD